MKSTRIIMGMPVEVELVGEEEPELREASEGVFSYFISIDERFSTYKGTSEISRINRGEISLAHVSEEMQEVFGLAEKTKEETNGYFDIRRPDGIIDPSGIVKGWAIRNAAARLRAAGIVNFMLNVGGDISVSGKNQESDEWSVGIRNPFQTEEIVKVVYPHEKGVATSGLYIRGDHIYNPHEPAEKIRDLASLTIIGPNVLEADRFATAAFVMGKAGIFFIENLSGFEGYAIDVSGMATMTSGFSAYLQ